MKRSYPLEVTMGPSDLAQLMAILETLAPKVCLEWGSGGGTLAILDHCPFIERYVSIEHDDLWYGRVKAEAADPRLELYHVPLDRPSALFDATRSTPTRSLQATLRKLWHRRNFVAFRRQTESDCSYLESYVAKPASLGLEFDFVLVDGRARNFCLPAGWELLWPGGVMVLHDAQREEYHKAVTRFPRPVRLEPYDRGQLCMFRKPD